MSTVRIDAGSSDAESEGADDDSNSEIGSDAEGSSDSQTSDGKGEDTTSEPAVEVPVVDPKTFAASLDSFRWTFACDRDVGTSQECDSPDSTNETKVFGGDSGKVYAVALRFRGVVEPMMYKDGVLDGERFYIGGTTNNGTYNIYSIEVSEPKQIYYLNSNPSVGHDVFLLDYKATIKIAAGATLKLVGNGQNLRMIANYKKLVVPGLDAEGSPFNGQYIQMNVEGVEVSP